jgi:hypothetical protein
MSMWNSNCFLVLPKKDSSQKRDEPMDLNRLIGNLGRSGEHKAYREEVSSVTPCGALGSSRSLWIRAVTRVL